MIRQSFATRFAAFLSRAALALLVLFGGSRLAAQARAGLTVPAGSTVDDFVVLRGPVDVYGSVTGDAVAVSGDLVVHPGARITGDAVSLFGHVRVLAGGRVTGAIRSIGDEDERAAAQSVQPVVPARDATWHALKLVLGWLTMLVVIGFGVLVTASPYLDGVSEAFDGGVVRAIGIGIAGQMLLLPALVALIVALALTIVGVLAIPLAIVAFVLAATGLLTLGFLAVAHMTGRSIGRRGAARTGATASRGEALRALVVGLAIFMAPWLAAAACASIPFAAVVFRTIALATTWVAITAGFGAALASRAGTRSEAQRAARRARNVRSNATAERDPYVSAAPGWQTPTPVSGVVAARRPLAVPSTSDR